MRQGYTVRDRGVRRIGGVLLAAGLLCAGWGAASEEGAGDGIRQLCASPKGDVIGTVVWDEQREAAVFVRDAATGAVRTVFRALLADYGEANLLTDAAARRAECAAVSEIGDAVVTWDGFAFDLYAPDGTTGALAKVGAWTLQISADDALRAEPRS